MVEQNSYGFYELTEKPSKEELEEYYSEKYYQEYKGTYEKEYSTEEVKYFNNKIKERFFIINKYLRKSDQTKTLLDIGCGEGWALSFFKERNWQVQGIDYSDYGCKKFNPGCIDNIFVGDIFERIDKLIKEEITFDVIWIDNVLEHVLDPKDLLNDLKKMLSKDGLLLIEVPNDFSTLQKYLYDSGHIDKRFWITVPDHISYFNKEGLINLLKAVGFEPLDIIGDYPIDLNLLNPDSNYVMDSSKGKNCHRERVEFENFLHSQPIELVVEFYKAMIDLGVGRQITGLFKL